MDSIFKIVLETSLSAGILVAIITLVRLVLRKAPKWLMCLMWILVAIRLLCPVNPESFLSLMPDTAPATQQILSLQPDTEIYTHTLPSNGLTIPLTPKEDPTPFVFRFWMVWIAGAVAMGIYALVSYLLVSRRVRAAIDVGSNIRQCDYIDTPFILGVFRPKIYLPSSLSQEDATHVLAHEQAHLKRKDHWWKPIGFLLLAVHWFNPMIWLAYILLCRDIELACDEKVIRQLDAQQKKAYSNALLNCSIKRPIITACPLAFGEIGIKARIRSILNYKKAAFWIVLITVVLTVILAVCFLTNRPGNQDPQFTAPTVHNDRLQATPTTEPTVHPNVQLLSTGHLKGKVISQQGSYIKVRVDGNDSVAMIYVNIAGFPNLPQLYPGDVIEAAFVPPENTVDQIDKVTQIERVQLADWGIWLEVSDVTAEGLELWVYRNSGIDRVHHISGTCTLERRNGAVWESVYVGAAGESARLAGGNPYRKKIRWTELCGVLEPGTYRLSKEVSHFESNQTRSYCVEFTINQPLTSTLEDAVSQTARYILSKQLVNPTAAHDKTLEHIKQGQDTGFLDNPSTSEPAGITFQQMVQSYQILDHQQEGNVHTVSVLGMCRGYNNRVLADEFFSPMLMVLEESPAGKFTVTSCKLPTQLYWQADIEFLFPEEIAKRIKENWHDRDSLEAACDKQVTGGVIELRGFGVTLAEGELNTTLVLQAISHGKPYSKAYTDTTNCTLYLGDTVYYYNLKTGICHNVIDGTTVVLTEEGRETVYAVLNAPE